VVTVHGVVAVSMSMTTRTDSSGRPSRFAAICRAVEACPCPCGTLPSSTVTMPCTSTLTRTCSVEPDLSRPGLRCSGGTARPT
jgi:hypothetical protein